MNLDFIYRSTGENFLDVFTISSLIRKEEMSLLLSLFLFNSKFHNSLQMLFVASFYSLFPCIFFLSGSYTITFSSQLLFG